MTALVPPRRLPVAPYVTAMVLAAAPAAAAPVWQRPAMSTMFSLHLPGGAALPAPVAAELDDIVRDVEATANEWRPGSPLSQLNRQAPAWVALPTPLLALLQLALEVAAQTEGAFDPSWAALWGLWDFAAAEPRPPSPARARARAKLVDFRGVFIDPARQRARLARRGMAVGLGGIAKGWALDRMAVRLRAASLDAWALDAGGQVLVAGSPAGGRPWQVGVRDPRGSGPEDAVASLAVGSGSVSTSGDYERFFEREGVRYHHLLDPRTGLPARGLRSATVVHAEAARADALSTAVFVAGRDKAATICQRLAPEGGCLLVDDAGALWISPSLRAGAWIRPGVTAHALVATTSDPSPTASHTSPRSVP